MLFNLQTLYTFSFQLSIKMFIFFFSSNYKEESLLCFHHTKGLWDLGMEDIAPNVPWWIIGFMALKQWMCTIHRLSSRRWRRQFRRSLALSSRSCSTAPLCWLSATASSSKTENTVLPNRRSWKQHYRLHQACFFFFSFSIQNSEFLL